MPCGSSAQSGLSNNQVVAGDPFSFTPGGAFMQGLSTWTAMWSAPWRAVAIMAEEALREGNSRQE